MPISPFNAHSKNYVAIFSEKTLTHVVCVGVEDKNRCQFQKNICVSKKELGYRKNNRHIKCKLYV